MLTPVDAAGRESFLVHPIGTVTTEGERTLIVLEERYWPGLLGLDQFSHIYVLWYLDRSDTSEKRAVLQVHPRGDANNPLTGVFATRSPARPNPIALTLCRIVSITGGMIEVEGLDALPDTPVIDLKPFLPHKEPLEHAKLPEWARAR